MFGVNVPKAGVRNQGCKEKVRLVYEWAPTTPVKMMFFRFFIACTVMSKPDIVTGNVPVSTSIQNMLRM